MYGEKCVKIERLENGYEISLPDPAVIKRNNSRDMNKPMPYEDPMKEYAFKTIEEVMVFLKANLDKALSVDEYATAFETAMKEENDD